MKIWRVKSKLDVGFEAFKLVDKEKESQRVGENGYILNFNEKMYSGSLIKDKLDNRELELASVGKECDLPDFTSSAGTLLLNEKAKRIVERLVEDMVEFIPFNAPNKTLYAVNILNFIAALNEEECEFEMLGRFVTGVSKYSFIKEKIDSQHIFKLISKGKLSVTNIYVSDEFKKLVEKNNLTGFQFIELNQV